MFDDIQRHISNYSVNRDEELVMSSEDFISYLQNHTQHKDCTWESLFLPQIEKIVHSVAAKSMETIESKHNYFELFGFDFAVDKNLKLWLIEVNMSPACAER